jgi:hypothetical protein
VERNPSPTRLRGKTIVPSPARGEGTCGKSGACGRSGDACAHGYARKDQPAGVRKWCGGGVPVSGLLFTGSCATAARGWDTRIEIRGGRFPRSRLSPRCAGSAGMSEREATCECRNGSRFLTFTGIYRQMYTANVWRVTRGQKRVEDALRRAYDSRVHPSSPNFAKRVGLHRNSGWPELRTVMRRESGKPDLHRNSGRPELRIISAAIRVNPTCA